MSDLGLLLHYQSWTLFPFFQLTNINSAMLSRVRGVMQSEDSNGIIPGRVHVVKTWRILILILILILTIAGIMSRGPGGRGRGRGGASGRPGRPGRDRDDSTKAGNSYGRQRAEGARKEGVKRKDSRTEYMRSKKKRKVA